MKEGLLQTDTWNFLDWMGELCPLIVLSIVQIMTGGSALLSFDCHGEGVEWGAGIMTVNRIL